MQNILSHSQQSTVTLRSITVSHLETLYKSLCYFVFAKRNMFVLCVTELCAVTKSVSLLKRLVAGLFPGRLGFPTRSVHMGFLVDKEIFSESVYFSRQHNPTAAPSSLIYQLEDGQRTR